MASAGNPNPATAFDMHRLFQSPNPNPNAPLAPSYPPSSYPIPSPSYPTPPGGPFYPPRTTPFHQNYLPYPPQEPLSNVRPSYPTPPSPNPNPNADPNHGARLMALLGTTPSSNPELPTSSSSGLLPEVFSQTNSQPGPTPVAASASLIQQATPPRLPSSKLPKGRLLLGNRVVYDVDARLHGELQPQLEVTPITKYVSDPALVVGRQIAVNRAYICYGLKLGAIRVLNINTALRSLLRGHTQRVTDMAFFAEDVHLLASASIDGRVFVWKINEGPDDEDKPQITGQIVIAIQIVGDEGVFHPRVCWHSHKQEVLVVGIGKHVLKIDTTKVGKGEGFLAEEPMKCPIDKLIEGIQLVGKHEGEVTALSMCQWMTTRLVSASVDGTVKIWEDRKPLPLVTLRPHDGQPVNSATFLKSPQRPDHIVLITAGHLNREVKMWTSTSQEGWLLPSDTELWHCTQTLELKSSAKSRPEEAFFNQVIILPRVGLILLANAKKNAIYAIHVDYGPHPSATHMDYLAEFTVTMPILSLTGTSDSTSDGEQSVQVYCVQTQAIQQYALDLSQCLPTPFDPELEACMNRFLDGPAQEIFGPLDPTYGNNNSDEISLASKRPKSVFSDGPELPSVEVAVPGAESKEPPATDIDNVQIGPSPLPLSPMVSGRLSGLGTPSNGFEQGQPVRDCGAEQPIHDRRVDAIHTNLSDAPTLDNNYVKDDTKLGKTDISVVPTTNAFRHPTHLITPSEILSMAVSSSEINDVNRNVESVELDVKVVGEIECSQHEEFGSPFEQTDKAIYTEVQGPSSETLRERASPAGVVSVQESRHTEDVNVTSEAFELSSSTIEEEFQEATKGLNKNLLKSTQSMEILESPSAVKGKKQKVKSAQVSGPSSTSQSPFNSTDSTESVPGTSFPTLDLAPPQLLAMQETLNQLVTMQKEMQKQMSTLVAVPVNKEGRRVETALGRSMEKAIKGNADALWARFQEENAKHEKMECDRLQQITGLISNCINKDLPSLLERTLKKELSAVGPTVSRSISQVVEKSISSAISESFQRGVGDKAVGQLEKSVYSKLEATVARQIQAQFQTTGKQTLQDVLRSSLESLVVPAFKMSCKAMFEQVDAAFQKGMIEHTTAAQQQFDSTHSPLAIALRDAINSASSVTQTLTGELADGQRKLLSLATAGANHKAISSLVTQQSNGPLAGLHEMVEAPVDPTKELQRLISERKYGEAFTAALQRSDVFIVSWLCSQVDLQGILTSIPLPLSQGVLLALLQQLACDIGNETARKLEWMGDIAIAINPVDPTIALHARPIFEQVYQLLGHQRSLPTTSPTDSNSIRLVMHVINSVLISCK